jgi:hypothetical protein
VEPTMLQKDRKAKEQLMVKHINRSWGKELEGAESCCQRQDTSTREGTSRQPMFLTERRTLLLLLSPIILLLSRVVKVKSSPSTRHGGAWGERRYSSYSFTTSALDGVSGQHHDPAALYPPGKGPPVPIVQEAGWAPEPVWTQRLEEKSSAPARDRTPIARSSSP